MGSQEMWITLPKAFCVKSSEILGSVGHCIPLFIKLAGGGLAPEFSVI